MKRRKREREGNQFNQNNKIRYTMLQRSVIRRSYLRERLKQCLQYLSAEKRLNPRGSNEFTVGLFSVTCTDSDLSTIEIVRFH